MKVRPFVVAAFLAAMVLAASCAPAPPPDPDAAWEAAEGECFTDPRFEPAPYDLRYVGPQDTPGNAVVFHSRDGTCSGEVWGPQFILRAPSYEAATLRCAEWGGFVYGGISQVSAWYPGFPVDGHLCWIPASDP